MIDLDTIVLKKGGHSTREDGMCLMEAVAYFAGEGHGDSPQCACRVLTRYGIRLNDKLSNDDRQLLKPLIPRIVGTRSTLDVEMRRAWLIVDRSIRVVLPIALDRRWPEHALKIRRLEQIKDKATAQAAWSLCREAYAAVAYAAAAAADAAAYADVAYAYAAAADVAAAYADVAYADVAYAYAAVAAVAGVAGEDADARKQIVTESIRTLEIALEIR